MNVQEYKAKLEEWKKAREAATQGPWYLNKDSEGDVERVHARNHTGCNEEDEVYNEVGIVKLPVEKYGYGCAWGSEPNGEFIVLSANHWTELIDAHIKAIEALEFYADINPDVPSAALAVDKFRMAKTTLSQITKGDET